MEEAPALVETERGREVQLLVVSARTEDALRSAMARLAVHLRARRLELAMWRTRCRVGRKEFEHRRAVVCRTVGEAIVALESVGQQALTGRIRAEFGEMELWVDADRLTVGCRGAALGEAAEWKGEREERENLGALLETVGRIWVAGAVVKWSGLYGHERRRRVPLPTYPFERKRYWMRRGRRGRLQREGFSPRNGRTGTSCTRTGEEDGYRGVVLRAIVEAVVHHGRVCGGRGVVGAVG